MSSLPPHQSHSATSIAAAASATKFNVNLRRQIYQWLLKRKKRGATDDEIQRHFMLGGNTQRPRRIELCDAGKVCDSGRRRRTRTRRLAVVWISTKWSTLPVGNVTVWTKFPTGMPRGLFRRSETMNDEDAVDPTEQTIRDFVAKAVKTKWPVYLGIDPGADGAIGLLCGDAHAVVDIPGLKVSMKRTKVLTKKQQQKLGTTAKTRTVNGQTTVFNFPAIVDLFRALKPIKDRIRVALEEGQVQVAGKSGFGGKGKRFGASALVAYKVGIGFGMWPLYFASRGWPVEIIKPGIWKKAEGLTGKGKEASRAKALSRWPRADLKRKKDHNRAEALLLADYLRKQHGAAH